MLWGIDNMNNFIEYFYGIKVENVIYNDGAVSHFDIFNAEFEDNDITNSVIFNSGKLGFIKESVFENNISNLNSQNIINKADLTLLNPKIIDDGKTVLNEGYLLIKGLDGDEELSQDFLSKINGECIISTDIIPNEVSFDFGYLDKEIHKSNSNEIFLNQDICLEYYEYDFYEGGLELDINNLIIDVKGHTIDGCDKSRIFTLKNITFKNGHSYLTHNSLNIFGGAIKINHDVSLTIENCKFINNTSELDGGAIYNFGELTIIDSTFNENTSELVGGAIHLAILFTLCSLSLIFVCKTF